MASKQDTIPELEGVAPFKELSTHDSKRRIQPEDNKALASCKVAISYLYSSVLYLRYILHACSTDHPELQKVIQRLTNHRLSYIETIDTSVKTAQNGYDLSGRAITLCGYLLSSAIYTVDLQEYIFDMQSKVKQAHQGSVNTFGMFTRMRDGLIEFMLASPKEVLVGTESQGIVIRLLSRVVGDKRDVDLDVAMKATNLTALDAGTLFDNVYKMVDWWTAIDSLLEKAEISAGNLKPGEDKFRVKALQRTWTGVRDSYVQYKVQAAQIQDRYREGSTMQCRQNPPKYAVRIPPRHKSLTVTSNSIVSPLESPKDWQDPLTTTPASLNATHDSLSSLEGVTSCKELDAITEGAFEVLKNIESWHGASTEHPRVQEVIQKIQSQAIVYFEAIDTSIKTVQDGYGFSCDAIELCGYLLDPETEQDHLQEYIKDMQRKANHAHGDCLMTVNKFRDVRKGLIEITKVLPEEAVSGEGNGEGIYIRLLYRALGNERYVLLDAMISELNLAASKMGNLAENVDKFAAWWGEMEMVLGEAVINANDLRPGRDKLRVKGMQRTWTRIRDDYTQYKVQIVRLQDHYAKDRDIEATK